jgi:hypothetical protein
MEPGMSDVRTLAHRELTRALAAYLDTLDLEDSDGLVLTEDLMVAAQSRVNRYDEVETDFTLIESPGSSITSTLGLANYAKLRLDARLARDFG